MLARIRNLAILLLAAALGGTALTPAQARAELACDVPLAAAIPAPPQPARSKEGRYRIFWQLSTQIEGLADAAGNPDAMADIKEVRGLADGYFVNALLGGPLIYWPTRPKECTLNFKRIAEGDAIEVDGETFDFEQGGPAGRAACLAKQRSFLEDQSDARNPSVDVQAKALARAFRNVDLAGEQKRGKPVWGEVNIRNTDFTYDKQADRVSMTRLPGTYCVLAASGIAPNALFIYQEPKSQVERDKFLWIPRRNNRGELAFTKPRLDKIPENAHAFGKIAEAFDAANLPVGGFRANIRRWNERRTPRMVEDLVAVPQFGGFNFEGGTRMLADEKKTPEHLIKGITHILTTTNRDISLLMPGYWDRDMVGSEEEIDTQVTRLRQLVTTVNAGLNAALKLPKGQNAICNERLVLIVGSYGRPVHVKPLPIRRGDGKLAGTVAGQIRMLADLRGELCGK
jgi:hypothetical protein